MAKTRDLRVVSLVVGSYYSSEVGQHELGDEGPAFTDEFPGCQHPDGHR